MPTIFPTSSWAIDAFRAGQIVSGALLIGGTIACLFAFVTLVRHGFTFAAYGVMVVSMVLAFTAHNS